MNYIKCGFITKTLHVDGEFLPLQSLIHGIPRSPQVNLASDNEHVPEIMRRILVSNESIRSARHSLPFKWKPKLFLFPLVFQAIKIMNQFRVKEGIYKTISPQKTWRAWVFIESYISACILNSISRYIYIIFLITLPNDHQAPNLTGTKRKYSMHIKFYELEVNQEYY